MSSDFSNTTPVPDTVFDELLSELTGNELKVLLYTWSNHPNRSLSQVTRVVTPSNDGSYPTSRPVVTPGNAQEPVVQQTGFQETEQQENTGFPSLALSPQEIQKQNESRALEIWSLIEKELKTTFSKTHRQTYNNVAGMKSLLEDDTSDATITTALKALPAFYRQQFNLKKFHELLPGLTSKVVGPPKTNGTYKPSSAPVKPSFIEASKSGMISMEMVKIALQAQKDGIPLPEENKAHNGLPECPHGLNTDLWFSQYLYRNDWKDKLARYQQNTP